MQGQRDAHPVPIRTEFLTIGSSTKARLGLVDDWIRLCQERHVSCQRTASDASKTRVQPTRLIDVSLQGKPRLITFDKCDGRNVRYATISHRWRAEGMPKLVQENIEEFKKHIDMAKLPRVFQDAITMCQKIDVRYLWIDALCLLQDDPVDCKREIAMMGDIYLSAFCNFSALAASDCEVGLFVNLDADTKVGLPPVVERQRRPYRVYAYSEDAVTQLNRASLMKRGWVMQERLLSPRTIYFGDQLMWECTEMISNETFPRGVPEDAIHPFNNMGFDVPFRMARFKRSPTWERRRQYRHYNLYEAWYDLVFTYSNCDLTYQSDVLPAISGLAKAFNESLNDIYLAGIWKKDLVRGLFWTTVWKPQEIKSSSSSQATGYRGEIQCFQCYVQALTPA